MSHVRTQEAEVDDYVHACTDGVANAFGERRVVVVSAKVEGFSMSDGILKRHVKRSDVSWG